jgi:hypothetical protein
MKLFTALDDSAKLQWVLEHFEKDNETTKQIKAWFQ